MGNAVSDGRPIAWKNRDDDGSPPHLVNYVTVSGGKYGILGVGYGSPFDIKMGVNDAGFSLVNSFCENMSGSSSYGDFKLFALSQMDSLAQMRQAIIEDTNGIVNHWDTEPAICVTFSDAHGYTSLFELQQRTISGLTYYEYNPVDPIRLTQFPRQIVVRSNTAHLNSNGQDDTSGDQRYTVARDDLVYHASNGGLTVKDWMQNISRHGQPSVDYLPNNYTTRAVFIVHGVNENEDPRITTAWLGLGNPDYTMVVPAWAAQTTNLSPRVTSGDSTGIAYVADALYYKHDHNYYDLYINSLFQPVENNIFEVVDNARSYWFSNGFNLEEATRIHMEAADTVWYTMNSMKAGSGRTLNVPPNLAAVNASTDGLVANFSLIASDGNGSITAYDWDFGDGTKSTVLSPTHTYTSAGTYLVRARVVDNGGARNSKWKYVTVSADIVTPTPTPTFTPTPTNTSTPTLTPTQPLTPTPPWTATDTPTDTSTPTSTPTLTATYTPTTTNTPTNTSTPTLTPTQPLTPTPPWTATDTPTDTSTPTSTPTLTATYTPTTTSTPTDTNTSTPTITPTNTATTTPTHPLATATPTVTASPSDTPTPTLSNTPTATSTPTPTDTPTPTNTPSATPSFTPTLSSDLIFADGFESGRLSAWSSNVNDGGDLSASSTAKLLGAFGLQAAIDDNNAIYVTDNLPNAEIRYRTRFYFDPNSIRMASSDTHYIFYGYSGTSTLVLRVQIRYLNATYQLRVALRNDSSTWTSSNWFTISDAPHAIELDWRAATISGAKNGGLTFWIDGTQLANLTGIDNDTRRIDTIWLGAVEGIDKGTRGTYFFDAFESHRQNYIGP